MCDQQRFGEERRERVAALGATPISCRRPYGPVDPVPSDRLNTRMVGRTLSHYEIVDEISRGGMGIVYRAVDVNLGREVALKVLPDDLGARPGAPRPPAAGGACGIRARASEHRGHPRGRRGRRRDVHRDGADSRREAERDAQPRRAAAAARVLARDRDCRRAVARAREEHHPPRSEAVQRDGHRGRARQDHRFRSREGRRAHRIRRRDRQHRRAAHRRRGRARHRRLHVARAGARRTGRSPHAISSRWA